MRRFLRDSIAVADLVALLGRRFMRRQRTLKLRTIRAAPSRSSPAFRRAASSTDLRASWPGVDRAGGLSVVIGNRAGAASNIAAKAVAGAAPDVLADKPCKSLQTTTRTADQPLFVVVDAIVEKSRVPASPGGWPRLSVPLGRLPRFVLEVSQAPPDYRSAAALPAAPPQAPPPSVRSRRAAAMPDWVGSIVSGTTT